MVSATVLKEGYSFVPTTYLVSIFLLGIYPLA